MQTLDDLHNDLRRRVAKAFQTEPQTDEEREVRIMALRDLYERYGNQADKLRGISTYNSADDDTHDLGDLR